MPWRRVCGHLEVPCTWWPSLDTRLSTALAPTPPPLEEWVGASPVETQPWAHHMVETLGQPLQAAGLAVSSDVKEGDPEMCPSRGRCPMGGRLPRRRGAGTEPHATLPPGKRVSGSGRTRPLLGGSHPPAVQALRGRGGIVVAGTDKRTSAMQPLCEGMYT